MQKKKVITHIPRARRVDDDEDLGGSSSGGAVI